MLLLPQSEKRTKMLALLPRLPPNPLHPPSAFQRIRAAEALKSMQAGDLHEWTAIEQKAIRHKCSVPVK